MRFELTENLALAKFEVGEWPRLESELLYWISGMLISGKSHLGIIVLNGPWSNKEPTSRLSAQGVRCNHCFTKDLQDLLKPDRKPFQSMRGDDSVSAVSMEIPHVHFKTTDNREQTDPDITLIDPSKTQSKACPRICSYIHDRGWLDNTIERIQKLCRFVEDEEVRTAFQYNINLYAILADLSAPPTGMSPPQAPSSLAGLEPRRAAVGNITTGIPRKHKGPNEGDILNDAVNWTRELIWMLNLKLQQQEEDLIADLGGTFHFEETEDERRMHTELMDAMAENDGSTFHSKVFSRMPRSVYAITTSKEFENRLDEALSRTMGENSGVKTASTISTMVYKLLKKNTEIIEAASDGDIARIAKLISLGTNVNTRDRWGVSYLLYRPFVPSKLTRS